MTKIFFFSLFFVASMFGFSSHNGESNSDSRDADVEITVTDVSGVPQSGKAVYLYKDALVQNSSLPGSPRKMLVTDKNGVARFSLNLDQLDILDSQTALYFAAFYTAGDEIRVAGSSAVTVKSKDSKKIELKIPL